MSGGEAEQLRDDIRVLRAIIDSAEERRMDERLLQACAEILRERREQLEAIELEAAGDRSVRRRRRD